MIQTKQLELNTSYTSWTSKRGISIQTLRCDDTDAVDGDMSSFFKYGIVVWSASTKKRLSKHAWAVIRNYINKGILYWFLIPN